MLEYDMTTWIGIFFIYCFLGWVWECLYVSARKRCWVNRGFLNGPLLPIYGTGAVTVLYLTLPVREYLWLVFLIGMVGATLLEFLVGYSLEKIFKMKYWDYSECFCNVGGYICLKASLCWGIFSVLLVAGMHRIVEVFLGMIPNTTLVVTDLLISILFVYDCVYSLREAFDLRDVILAKVEAQRQISRLQKRMDVVIAVMDDEVNRLYDRIEDRLEEELREKQDDLAELKEQLSQYSRRLKLRGTRRHEHALQVMRRNPGGRLPKKLKNILSLEEIRKYLEGEE